MRYEKYKQTGIPWLPEVPLCWNVAKVGQYFCVRTEKVSEKDFPALSVAKQGVVPQLSDVAISLAEGDTRKLVRKDDFVVNSRSDRKGSCGIAPRDGSVTTISIVLEPRNVFPLYVHYLFRSHHWVEEFYRHGRGIVADLWTTNYQQMKGMCFPYPPLLEQRAIVAYLDDKCGKIDELVAAKEKEVELLKELKQRVIADAVTGKCKVENGKCKMRQSGIPWLPQIPEGWELVRNKSFLRVTDEKVGDRKSEFTLLSLTKQGVIIRDLTEGKGKFPKDFDTYLVVRPGNLVFCLFDVDETPRTVGLVKNIGMLTGAYTNFEVNERVVLPAFAYYFYLQIDDAKKLRPFYTGLRKVVKTNTFLQLRMPVPPLEEQRAIVAFIEEKTAKIDQAVEGLTQQVAALKEYKQRLIADVVTGQMKVA